MRTLLFWVPCIHNQGDMLQELGHTLFRSPAGEASADVSLSRHPDTRQPASRLAAA